MSHWAAAHLQRGRGNECAAVPASVVEVREGVAGSGLEAASPVANTVLSCCQNSRRASDLEFRVAHVGSHCPREDGVLSTAAGARRLRPQQ